MKISGFCDNSVHYCDVVSTWFSNHMLFCPFYNWPILFSPWINCLPMGVDWFCDTWSQITFAKSKKQGKFWKILTKLVEIWTSDHIVGKQALYQSCYDCLLIFKETFSIMTMELVAQALATATGKHGSVLRMELVMHAPQPTYPNPPYGCHNSMEALGCMDQCCAWISVAHGTHHTCTPANLA